MHRNVMMFVTSHSFRLFAVGALVAFRAAITDDPRDSLAGWNASLNPNPCSLEGVGCTKAGNVNQM